MQSSVTATVPVLGTNVQKTTTTVDALGRPIKQQITDAGSTSYSIVETKYDALSRPYMSSNPHNGTPQYWTTTQFDGLGRVARTVNPKTNLGGPHVGFTCGAFDCDLSCPPHDAAHFSPLHLPFTPH